jgi:hypothetical protein
MQGGTRTDTDLPRNSVLARLDETCGDVGTFPPYAIDASAGYG